MPTATTTPEAQVVGASNGTWAAALRPPSPGRRTSRTREDDATVASDQLFEVVPTELPAALISGSEGSIGSRDLFGRAPRFAGLQVFNADMRPTRESLLEQGIRGTEADVILVRLHEEEVLIQNFRRWVQCFSFIVCMLTPAMMGIMIWMLVEFAKYGSIDCDVPLQMWCLVVVSIVVFNATLNRPGRTGSLIVRLFCLWEQDPHVHRPPPSRVRLYNGAVALFIFSWNLYGLYMILVSGSLDSQHPPCASEAPGLYSSVKVYAALNLTFTIFFYVNMVGFSRVLGLMLRRGLLHSSKSAPKGTLDKRTHILALDDPVFKDQTSCSICLDEYADSKRGDILQIKGCGHAFHRSCLQGWLNVNRNCPICRHDLVDTPDPG